MKIAVDCRMLNCSGIGTFLQGILQFFIRNTSLSFLLIGNECELKKYEGNNITILNCNIPIFSKKELFNFPVKEINKYDVFYSPNYNIPLGIRIPVVSTIHDVIFLDLKGLCSGICRLIRWGYLKYAILRSKKIITVSQFSRNRILYHFNTKRPITVCYNGLSENLKEYALKHDEEKENYFVFVGNVKKHKGLSVLIKAFKMAKERGLAKKLLIVGNKENFKTSDKSIEENVDKDIVFTGRLDDEKLYQIIQKAEALILPTLYEGFGIPPLEAMALGTHAIVSDIPVMKEIYSDFPVTFFKSEDSDDLADKLIKDYPRIHLDSALKDKYSYGRAAENILNILSSIS